MAKIRTGFVSNSSTSSFILVGCRYVVRDLNSNKELDSSLEKTNVMRMNDYDLIGITLATFEDDSFASEGLDINVVQSTTIDMAQIVDDLRFKFGERIQFDKVKLHYGMQYS